MSFWKKVKQTAIVDRLVEEKIYEQVLREIESGIRRDGLWAKALQESRGDVEATQAYYIKYRVQSIKDEAEIAQTLSDARGGERKPPEKKSIAVEAVKSPSFFSEKNTTVGAVKSPNFFTYKNTTVYRQDKTWWVGNKSFLSQEEAKNFIDNGHL